LQRPEKKEGSFIPDARSSHYPRGRGRGESELVFHPAFMEQLPSNNRPKDWKRKKKRNCLVFFVGVDASLLDWEKKEGVHFNSSRKGACLCFRKGTSSRRRAHSEKKKRENILSPPRPPGRGGFCFTFSFPSRTTRKGCLFPSLIIAFIEKRGAETSTSRSR